MTLALMLLVAAACAYLVREIAASARARTEQQLLETARALAQTVDAEFDRHATILTALKRSEALERGDFQALHRLSRELVQPDEWVVLNERSGRQLMNSRLSWGEALPAAPPVPAWALRPMDEGRPQVCRLSRGVVTQRILCLNVPVTVRNGRVERFLSLVFRPERLQKIIDRQQVAPGSFATVIDATGTVVWRNVQPERFVGGPATADMRKALVRAPQGIMESRSLEGVSTILAYSRGQQGLTFLLAIPRSALSLTGSRSTVEALAVAFLMIGLAVLLAALAGRRLSGAIQNLHEAADALRAGAPVAIMPTGIPEVDSVGVTLSQAIAARQTSDERFALAQEVGGVGAWDWDIAADAGNVTSGYRRLHGLPDDVEPLALRQIVAILHPQDRQRYIDGMARNMLATKPVAGEYRVLHPDGSVHWVAFKGSVLRADDGTPLRSIGIVRDVTTERETEAALSDSAERLRLATEGTGVGIYDLDLSTGSGIWSDRAFQVLGHPVPGDRLGSFELWRTAIHPDDLDRVLAEHQANAERLSTWQAEYRVLHLGTGEERWLETYGRFVRQPSGHVRSIGVVADVTERKGTTSRLAMSESRLRRSQDAGGIGSYEWDLTTGEGAHSEGMLRMVGLPPGSSYRLKDILAPVLEEDLPQVRAAVEAIGAGAARRETLYRIRHPQTQAIRWIRDTGQAEPDADGKPHRWVGIIQDVTEQVEAERALTRLTQTLEAEVALRTEERDQSWRLSRDLLCIWTRDGRIVRGNPAWHAILGYAPTEIEGRHFSVFAHPDDEASNEASQREAIGGALLQRVERRARHKDGSWRWISWTAVPEGDFIYASGQDVTDEKDRQAELERTQEALRQSQKLESMGQLTGGVAHDFNNLLTPIIGSLDLLQQRRIGGEREQRMIDGALQSAERAKTLVQRLLAFARRQPLQAVPIDLAGLIGGMAELIASTSGPKVRLLVDIAPALPPVIADINQIELALLNLCVNARDAMPSGGQLTISAAPARVGAGHRAQLPPGRYVRLTVADTGVGMDADTLRRAVEPFFSTKGIGKGTGLGLSMVHGLAAQLGGALLLDSKAGLGTTAELWLPVAKSAPARPVHSPEEDSAPIAETVLLVDDEKLVRASTAEMLADLGYAVVEAESAEDALRLIDGGLSVGLLVTDHLMPGLSGTDLARKVRERSPAMRVLIISGYAEVEGIAADLPRLVKPFRRAELAGAIARLAEATAE